MGQIRMTLEFVHDDGTTSVFTESAGIDRETSAEGEENLAIEIAAELEKGVQHYPHYQQLPWADEFVKPAQCQYTIEEQFDVLNRENLWMEISNTLADVRYLLAQAKAYKDLEPPSDRTTRKIEQLRYYAHFEKMYSFNLALWNLVKIQDLVVRLLFEGFGGTLIEVDIDDDEWEKQLTLKRAKKGLQNKLESGELNQPEYSAISSALEPPSFSGHEKLLVNYRNRLTHRIRPAVDYPELYTHMQDRKGQPVIDHRGQEIGRVFAVGARPRRAEFQFNDLYQATEAS